MIERLSTPLLFLPLCLLALAGEPAEPTFLQGEDREAFLAKVEKRMSGVRSFAASFVQVKDLKLFRNEVRSEGWILFSRPAKLRWEIRKPFRSILVVAGSRVGKFEYVGERRKKLELARRGDVILIVMEQIRSWFDGKFDRHEKHYAVRVAKSPRPLIVLRPRVEALEKNIQKIELELSTDLSSVSKVTLLEGQGDRTTMKFTELRRDLAFPAPVFSVTDPLELDEGEIQQMPPLPEAPKKEPE